MFVHQANLNNMCFDQVFHNANQNIEFLWLEKYQLNLSDISFLKVYTV